MKIKDMKPSMVIGGVFAIFDVPSEEKLPEEQVTEPVEEK